ncbi:MAG TPA: lipid-A-disaccharide synthase [Verrucomicrobiae bacterium]|nr:lipid-A-disaccharide synthase [Verrucomicrobiae bacterium]
MAGIGVKIFMLIAGEPSGDLLASELVLALRERWPDAKFFGAGGQKMAEAGVELAFDMKDHAIVGIPTPGKILALRYVANELRSLAIERRPDAVIGVDYGGFNLRFGHAIKSYVRANPNGTWKPKLVQFVSPQVWASRPGRAKLLESDYDLLLSIFPFEKEWYALRAPKLQVEFVGHPMMDRLSPEPAVRSPSHFANATEDRQSGVQSLRSEAKIVLLPGSRKSELKQHLPVMLGALNFIQEKLPSATAKMVLPNEELKQIASSAGSNIEIRVGNLHEALASADLAITKTGTVTMECAYFGVPAVTMYKKTFLGLAIALGIVTVKSLTMPNLMAGDTVYPEFIQAAATSENVARAAMELLQNESRREKIKSQLGKIIASLGEPGASRRAAGAISSLIT